MIDKKIEQIINHAFRQADRERYEFFTTEHMLLALVENDATTTEVLLDLNVDIEALCKNLDEHIKANCPKITSNDGILPTDTFNRVIERTIMQRRSAGKNVALGIHLIVSLLEESDNYAAYYLGKEGVTRLNLIQYLAENDDLDDLDDSEEADDSVFSYFQNLNELAKNGKIDRLIGREKEVERLIQTLARRRKNNPILIGEAGVGKTAIIEGLAKRIVESQVPEALKTAEICSLDLGAIVAGSKYRGDFEKKLKRLIHYFSENPNCIVFIDEIHMLLGAGATSESTLDASNLLKPALASGNLRCIGATTYQEYKNSFERNHALARRFQKIEINEPSLEDTKAILKGLQGYFEDFHQVKYSPAALEAAVELSNRFVHDKLMPDKAIDVIDEAGAKAKLSRPAIKTIDSKLIENIVAEMAKVPMQTIENDDKRRLKQLSVRLQKKVFGQNPAIDALSNAIKLSKAGLRDEQKPIGAFLFTGPTGVGKTEISKQLAEELGIQFTRFDMSEYMEAHSVARLIGSPPGYVGFDKGGLLTESISKHPHCVLLLDEVEKAHPDVLNILLQIMDYGKLTDTNGKTVYFNDCILIMTSNVGAATLESNSIGFQTSDTTNTAAEAQIKRFFSPEFRNRLTQMIAFAPLNKAAIEQVIHRQISLLNAKLSKQNIILNLSKAAENYLLDKGYSKTLGARPMQRLIERDIMQALADEILFGKLKLGGTVQIDADTNKLSFSYSEKAPAVAKITPKPELKKPRRPKPLPASTS